MVRVRQFGIKNRAIRETEGIQLVIRPYQQ